MAPWHLLWEWREISLSAIFLFQQWYLGFKDGTLAFARTMKRNLTVCYVSVSAMIYGLRGWHLSTWHENEEKSYCLLYFCFSNDVWLKMTPWPLARRMKRNLTVCYISVSAKTSGFRWWHLGPSLKYEEKSHCLLYFCFSKDIWVSRISTWALAMRMKRNLTLPYLCFSKDIWVPRMAPWHLLWEWRENSLSAIFLFQQRYIGSEDGSWALAMRMKRNLTVCYQQRYLGSKGSTVALALFENEETSHCLLYFCFSMDIWVPAMANRN